jgi:hypothetical protein
MFMGKRIGEAEGDEERGLLTFLHPDPVSQAPFRFRSQASEVLRTASRILVKWIESLKIKR